MERSLTEEFTLYRIFKKPIRVLELCGLNGRESTDGDTFYVSKKLLKKDLIELLKAHDDKFVRLYVFTNPFKKGDREPDATLQLEVTDKMWDEK